MKVLLLVAGRSRRFWPLAEKSLSVIAGKTLLAYQIERLQEAGCKDITLVYGDHNGEALERLFPGLPLIKQENLEMGMQGALLSALPNMGDDPVLVVSSNDVIEAQAYRDLIKAAKGNDGAMLAQRVSMYFPGGYLTMRDDRITGIAEKPGAGNEPSDLVNIVAHVHNKPADLLAALRRVGSETDDGYERALTELFAELTYRAVPYEGLWHAVKYPWHLLNLLPLFLEQGAKKPRISKKAHIHPTAVVEGDVIIEDGVRILAHATVVGPCFIGKNSLIGTGALIRLSSIGEHCIVGFGSEIKSSILGDNVWTHMTYLGDSVIAGNVSFGAGTVTGNLRLDEGEIRSMEKGVAISTGLTKFGFIVGEGSRIGIQVGSNPGVKIGRGSFIAGRTYVNTDVPDGSYVTMKGGEMHVRENRSPPPSAAEREKYRKI